MSKSEKPSEKKPSEKQTKPVEKKPLDKETLLKKLRVEFLSCDLYINELLQSIPTGEMVNAKTRLEEGYLWARNAIEKA